MPMYLSGMDFLLMQVSNTPHGDGRYSYQSVKYNMPMLFYNHCDYIYEDENEQTEAVDKVASLTNSLYDLIQSAVLMAAEARRVSDDLYRESWNEPEKTPLEQYAEENDGFEEPKED